MFVLLIGIFSFIHIHNQWLCRCTLDLRGLLFARYTWELQASRLRAYDTSFDMIFSTAFSRTGKSLLDTLIVYYPSATVFRVPCSLHLHLSVRQHSSQVCECNSSKHLNRNFHYACNCYSIVRVFQLMQLLYRSFFYFGSSPKDVFFDFTIL